MKRSIAVLLLVAVAAWGCATYQRGRFPAVSTRTVAVPMTIVKRDALGRSCQQLSAQRYQLAVANALRDAPGANALVNATYSFEELCLVVRGTAVHVD